MGLLSGHDMLLFDEAIDISYYNNNNDNNNNIT